MGFETQATAGDRGGLDLLDRPFLAFSGLTAQLRRREAVEQLVIGWVNGDQLPLEVRRQFGDLQAVLGQKAGDTAELFFDAVCAPACNLLGEEEGRGFAQLMQQLPRERLLIAVGAVATMRRAIDETVAYTRTRQVFGQPLIDLQNTRFKLAECETVATIAARFVDVCIARQLDGTLDLPTAAMAKWWTTQMNCQVIDECLQLHGGYGYMLEYPIARMYADARVGKIYGGSNEIMKEIIARGLVA